MGTRRRARECALQMLFQWEGERGDPAAVQETFWHGWRVPITTRQFAEELFTGTLSRVEEIDQLIARHAEHWRLERMAAVDRNLLRLATYELQARPDTPPAVVIDEALEIARRFSSAESVEFINGVLDSIRQSLASGARVNS